jgi:hypothetical protein
LIFQEYRAHRYVLHPMGAEILLIIVNADRLNSKSTPLNCRL